MWNHVRAIFAEEGADNAKWVWTPTTWHFVTGNAPAFYPGDDVVDVIGADGYLWSPCQGEVETAVDVFGAFLDWADGRDKPVVFCRVGRRRRRRRRLEGTIHRRAACAFGRTRPAAGAHGVRRC